ncbi:PilZ domain-containing protein [bacterium]|nr:PilZ domain-containing protein [bacterium]
MTERRKNRRIPYKAPMEIAAGKRRLDGYFRDISSDGALVAASEDIAVGERIRMIGEINAASVRRSGTVRWTRHLGLPPHAPGPAVEFGVHFDDDTGGAWSDAVAKHEAAFVERRAFGRPKRTLRVVYVGPNAFLEESRMESFTADIGRGGAYVVARRALPLNARVDIEARDDSARASFAVQARVASVVSEERATRLGTPPGFGLEFITFHDEGAAHFAAYLERVASPAGGAHGAESGNE